MTDNLETKIRMVLDTKAHEVEVPSELATRTLEKAAAQPAQPLIDRVSSWRDARSTRRIVSSAGAPRWAVVAVGGLAAVFLFIVGSLVVNGWRPSPTLVSPTSGEEKTLDFDESYNYRSERAESPGRVSSGDASADEVVQDDSLALGIETGEEYTVSPGDADGDDSAASFTGLTAGNDAAVAQDILNLAAQGALDPKLVRAADIEVAVENFEDAWGEANEVATNHDGHVIDSKTTQVADEIAKGTVTMRVPTSELEDVLADLRGLGTLARLDTTGDDISEQIASVEEQIADRKEEEKELTALLNRAGTLAEQNDIRSRREDIRKKIENLVEKAADYEEQVATSIVRATIVQDEVAAGSGGSIVGNAAESAGHLFLTITAGMLVLLGALAPVAILTAALWFAIRTVRNRRKSS
ncbi:MAG: DUF4349 domain-containing protein [Actinomycetota bacterium]